jgi:predicted nucleic acid-binding protein
MITKVVVDSNVFVSLFLEGDINRDKAVKFFHNVFRDRKTQIFISAITFPEVCGVIARRISNKEIVRRIESKINEWIESKLIMVVELTKDRIKIACDCAIEFGLKGADAIIVSLVKELNIPLLTFDEEIKRKVKNKIQLFEEY